MKNNLRKLGIVILVIGSLINSTTTVAQTPARYPSELGAWYMLFTQSRISDKFSIHAEAQHRLHKTADTKQQLLLRTALNYHVDKNVMVTAGYGNIHSWFYTQDTLSNEISPNAFPTVENRIYQQLVLKHKYKKWNFGHRYRLEQRWVNDGSGNGSKFLNRARYFFQVDIPILTLKNSEPVLTDNVVPTFKQQLYYSFYDEIFLNISDSPFSQNRFFHAIGFKFSPAVTAKIGYLYNFTGVDYNRLQFGLWLKPDFRNKQ